MIAFNLDRVVDVSFDPASFRRRVQALLDRHATTFNPPAGRHAFLREQIERGDDIHLRSTFPGHVTTSAIILDQEGERTLLIRHRSLSRWLQPGGHYEPPDDLAMSALREAIEETGLQSLCLDRWHQVSGLPIDIDSHSIPARPGRAEPEHWHHDIRYIVRAQEGDCLRPDLTEVDKAEWHDISALEEITPQALRNMRGLGLIRSSHP